MKHTKALTIALAAVVLIGGMAAVGAASPADEAPENATDAYEENAPADAADGDNMTEDRNDSAESIGPSDGLPSQVPDHVSQIHETIGSYLDGSIDSLGDALSNLLGGDNGGSGSGDGSTADAGSA
jgi:hypothetical protein